MLLYTPVLGNSELMLLLSVPPSRLLDVSQYPILADCQLSVSGEGSTRHTALHDLQSSLQVNILRRHCVLCHRLVRLDAIIIGATDLYVVFPFPKNLGDAHNLSMLCLCFVRS